MLLFEVPYLVLRTSPLTEIFTSHCLNRPITCRSPAHHAELSHCCSREMLPRETDVENQGLSQRSAERCDPNQAARWTTGPVTGAVQQDRIDPHGVASSAFRSETLAHWMTPRESTEQGIITLTWTACSTVLRDARIFSLQRLFVVRGVHGIDFTFVPCRT